MAVSDQVIRDGGTDVERLRPYLSEPLYADEEVAHERLRANQWHGVGYTEFSLALQTYDNESLSAYVCDDVSNAVLVDVAGVSVVKPERSDRIPFEVEFDLTDAFRITRKELWSGGGVC